MKVLIIDGTNNFIRAWAAIPTMDRNGNPNGGTYGMLFTIGYVARIMVPDKIYVVWDGVGGSQRRRRMNENYKQGRKPTRLNRNFEFELENVEQNKFEQRRRTGEYLSDLPLTQITIDNIEADDVIAYLTKIHENDEITISSTDKDFYQLLSDKVRVYSPHNKEFIDVKKLLDKTGIHPVNYALAKAIMGDKSDNISGVSGIKEKTLVKLFPEFSLPEKLNVDKLLEICNNDPKKYKRIIESKDIVINNLEIVQLEKPIISFHSINKIHEHTAKEIQFNATNFRVKLMEDGITTIPDSFFQSCRILEMRGKVNARKI